MITPHQIGSALGKITRYGGRAEFCSDLLHSMVVAALVPPPIALHGILHDAAEIWTGDCNSVFKNKKFRRQETALLRGLYAQLGLPFPSKAIQAQIKIADNKSRNAEIWCGIGDTKLRGTYPERDKRAEQITRKLYRKYPPPDCIRSDGKAVAEFVRLFALYKSLLQWAKKVREISKEI